MEFNAFQMMNQTHEHECHFLTRQMIGKKYNNKQNYKILPNRKLEKDAKT